ncbi:formyl transferase [Phlyctochytrium arcticum]|nr:formyl transferase [Phlyctochytrium arcticum]
MPVWSSAKRRLGQCLLSRNTFGVVGLGLRQTNAGLRRLNTPSLVQKPYNILFFGTDEFSIICLDRLRREQLENPGKLVSNIEVVTPPDNPRNKIAQVPLRLFASKHDITSHYAPPKSLRGWELPISMTRTPFDLAIVVSFGYFLPRSLIAQFRAGAFNIHPSLLPRHRGAAPLQHTILSGDTETGVSIIALDDKRFDTGEVLKQTRIPIASDVHYKELHDTLGRIGAEDMLRTLQDLERFKAEAKPQCEEGATKAPKVDKQDALIDWQDSADRIYRLHRAIGYRVYLVS